MFEAKLVVFFCLAVLLQDRGTAAATAAAEGTFRSWFLSLRQMERIANCAGEHYHQRVPML